MNTIQATKTVDPTTLREYDEVFANARRGSPHPEDLDAGFLRPREVEYFRQVVNEDGSETALDHCLRGYPDLWSAFLYQNSTGHQGGKVLSQQVIPTEAYPIVKTKKSDN